MLTVGSLPLRDTPVMRARPAMMPGKAMRAVAANGGFATFVPSYAFWSVDALPVRIDVVAFRFVASEPRERAGGRKRGNDKKGECCKIDGAQMPLPKI